MPRGKLRAPPGKVTQRDLARQFRLSVQQIANLDAKGLPSTLDAKGRKWYEPLSAWQWYMEHKLSAAHRKGEAKPETDSKARKLEAEARKLELDVMEREGSLVPLDYMEDQLRRICDRLRSQLITLPGRWAPSLVGLTSYQAVQLKLEQAMMDCMNAMSATGEDPDLDDEPSGNGHTAPAGAEAAPAGDGGVAKAPRRRHPRRARPAA